MLSAIQVDIKRNYYDAAFHGAGIEARFNEADAKMKQAASINEILEIIANVVDSIEDSHTFFLPPSRTVRIEHGHPRLGLHLEPAAIEKLALERGEEALCHRIVVGIGHGAHRGPHTG